MLHVFYTWSFYFTWVGNQPDQNKIAISQRVHILNIIKNDVQFLRSLPRYVRACAYIVRVCTLHRYLFNRRL